MRILPSTALLLVCVATGHAQSFFTPTAQYLTPSWRPGSGEFSRWDVFYSPYNGINYPDMVAPHGIGGYSAGTGITPPANSSPSDPYAFWNTQNPTVTQTGTNSAFIIGAGSVGNIYSFSAATAFEVADATSYDFGTVNLQWQTEGSLLNYNSVRLVVSGVEYAPTNFITEYKSSSTAFGNGFTNRASAQWNITALGLSTKACTIKFAASGSSNSMQELLLDTAPTYAEATPSTRTWNSTTGNWSDAGNWTAGGVPSLAGNVTFASGSGAVLDGTSRTVSELKLTAPGTFAIGATGGASLKINTGITATPASPASYTIAAPVVLGSLNLTNIGAGSEVTISGEVSGNAGIYKLGTGALRLNGGVNLTAPFTVAAGTVEFGGASAVTDLAMGPGTKLIVNGSLAGGLLTLDGATLSGTGTVNRQVNLDTGDILSPGNSVGILTTIAETWAGGGIFLLEVVAANDTPGLGWDLVMINGALTLSATPSSRFTVDLDSIGLALNFNAAQGYAWKFASASSIGGFDAGAFQVDASGFTNATDGSFSVSRTGGDLFLNYTPVPEPGAGSLCILGVAGLALWQNRRFISGRDRIE